MEPIWRLFNAALDLQSLRAADPDHVPNEVDAIAREMAAALVDLESTTRDAVRDDARLAPALDAFNALKNGIAFAIDSLDAGDAQRACTLLETAVGENLSGLGLRTIDNPFALFSTRVEPASRSGRRRPSTSPPPQGDDLQPLHGDAFDPAIMAQVVSLGRDARRIYEFVATKIDHALYQGHFRAPHEVLHDGVANDADLSGLLVELLRASGIRARLVSGPMRLTESVAAKWLDISDRDVIDRALRDAGYTVLASDADGVRTFDVIEHFRVRAKLGDAWIDLDPCVRPFEIVNAGTRAWTESPWSAQAELDYFADSSAANGPLARYDERLGAQDSDLRVRRRAPIEDAFPPPLPYETPGVANEQTGFDARQEHAIHLVLTGPGAQFLDYRFPTRTHCRSAVVLRWTPATPDAEQLIKTCGGSALAAPAFALDLRPRLEMNGAIVAEGTGGVPAGTQLLLQITIEHPNPQLTRTQQAHPECGTDWVLAFEGPGALLHGAAPRGHAPLTTGARSRFDLVEPLIRAYHRRLARAASRIAALTGAIGASGPLVTLATAAIETLSIRKVAIRRLPSSFFIDVKNIDLRLYDSAGTESLAPYVELFLSEGSNHEAQCMIDHLGIEATSTVVALREAAKNSNPLRVITRDSKSDIDALDYPDRVKNTLRFAFDFDARDSIIIPQRPVDFRTRQVTAWIARGGTAPMSDYAIAGLNGGLGGGPPPPRPPKPHVHIYNVPKEKLANVREPTSVEASAYDDDGNDLTSELTWRVTPPIAGSGSGGAAMYIPNAPGRYTVVAQLGGEQAFRGSSESEGGSASDSMTLVAWDVKIEQLVFDATPEMHRVTQSGGVEKFDKVHYAPDRAPSPAALVAKEKTTATMKLKVTPMTSDPAQLTIEAKGKSDDDVELLKMHKVVNLRGPFEDSIQLEVEPANAIGVVRKIEWLFTLDPDHVIEQTTNVRVFVTGGPSKALLDHRFDEIFEQSCTWAAGVAPADQMAILTALFANHSKCTTLKFSYKKDMNNPVGTGLDGLLSKRTGACPEFAHWFLALGYVHGINGQVLFLSLVADESNGQRRWDTMYIQQRGFNNDPDGPDPDDAKFFVAAGKYVTNGGTDWADLIPIRQHVPAWQFNHHYIALFHPDNGPLNIAFDVAMQEGATFTPPFVDGAEHELGPDDAFRNGYLRGLITYFRGKIRFSNHDADVMLVHNEDVRAAGESVRFLFRVRDPEPHT